MDRSTGRLVVRGGVVMEGIAKRFGHRWALRGASFRAEPGSVLALMGHNGSGTTTLDSGAAGPMQVPVMGILKSSPEKQKHVYCISHSRWNDGFSRYKYTHTKRDVMEFWSEQPFDLGLRDYEGNCDLWDITQFAWVGGPWPGSNTTAYVSGICFKHL